MQLASDTSIGFLSTLWTILSTEGSGALFKGLKPALLRQASYQSVKMFLYEPIRDAVLAASTPEGEERAPPVRRPQHATSDTWVSDSGARRRIVSHRVVPHSGCEAVCRTRRHDGTDIRRPRPRRADDAEICEPCCEGSCWRD